MNKFCSLLKASMSQDMSLFKVKTKDNNSNLSKVLVPLVLSALVMFSIGSMYAPIGYALKEVGFTYVLLEIAIAFPSILAFIEGMYKSQGILFDAKDNELLLSLPISKKQILLDRLIKLYVFQFLYSLLFTLPGIAIYAYFENPSVYFYVITIITLVLFPIIPTVLGSVIGYMIKQISVKFNSQKIIQLLITFTFISIVMIASFNSEGIIDSMANNAEKVDLSMQQYYYPISAYVKLIDKFDLITFVALLAVNAIFVLAFTILASKNYFKIISKSKENNSRASKKNIEPFNFKKKHILVSLIKKEFARYFSSTIYMINTLIGLLLLLIATIGLSVNFDSVIFYIANGEITIENIAILHMLAPKMFLAIIIAMSFMTSITSSSISLEGKSFNISKSLPVKVETQLFAKVLMSNIITIPVILVCDIIFFFSFDVNFIDILSIFVATFVAPSIAATFGLIVNLKFPKMDASSDEEVVKQSMSSMVAVLGGIFTAGVFVALTFALAGLGDYALLFEVALLMATFAVLWVILSKYGKKRYREIEI